MNDRKHTFYEDCIPEEELPVRTGMKVIRQTDPDYGLTDDEIADRKEFIRCYLMREFELLMMIPSQGHETDFFIPDCQVSDEEYSAFNTVDFQRTLKPFDSYNYAMKKIMERVEDLAILYSAIMTEEGKHRTFRRFNALVECEFRERLLSYVDRYHGATHDDTRYDLKQKIGEMNRRIIECRKIWEHYAPRDT